MKREIKKIWIDALTSGKYRQTDGKLKSDGKYCCLGVLCDLHRQITGKGKWTKDMHGDPIYEVGPDEYEDTLLPEIVMKWSGIKTDNGTFVETIIVDDYKNYEETTLVNKNDEDNLKFKEIAVFIEKYF